MQVPADCPAFMWICPLETLLQQHVIHDASASGLSCLASWHILLRPCHTDFKGGRESSGGTGRVSDKWSKGRGLKSLIGPFSLNHGGKRRKAPNLPPPPHWFQVHSRKGKVKNSKKWLISCFVCCLLRCSGLCVQDGNEYQNAVFNETVQVVEPDEGLDGET